MCKSPIQAPSPATNYQSVLSMGKIRKKSMQKAMVGRHSLHFFLAFSGFIGIFFFGYSLGVQRQNAGLPRVDDAPAVHGTNIRGPQRVAKSQGHSQNFGKNEEEQTSSVPSRPDGWEEYSRTDVREHYECRAYARDHKRAMPTMEYWHLLRKQYNDIVDGTANLDDPVPPTHGYTLDENGAPPFHAKYADDKGRGLFASRDIKKGELVHDGTNSDVVFPNATLWRQFIFSLPKNMACDVTEWQWTQALTEGGNLRICLAPSIASLMNTSDKSPNILPKSNSSTKMYAQRDIKEGELEDLLRQQQHHRRPAPHRPRSPSWTSIASSTPTHAEESTAIMSNPITTWIKNSMETYKGREEWMEERVSENSINAQKYSDERHAPTRSYNMWQYETRMKPNFHPAAAVSGYAGKEAGHAGSYAAMRYYQGEYAKRRDEILTDIAKNG